MAFFKHLEEEVRDGYDRFKEDLKLGHDAGSEASFVLPGSNAEEVEAACCDLLTKYLDCDKLNSPVNSVVYSVSREADHCGVTFADALGLVVKMAPEQLAKVKVLVERGQSVKEGQTLMELPELKGAEFFIIASIRSIEAEDEPQNVQRVFGPFVPQNA